ncbi:MAG: hypothetical protein GC156_03200 [Actinomycetales bacterium]|nr:hypothetical protein [Actinomycetales bacterium]
MSVNEFLRVGELDLFLATNLALAAIAYAVGLRRARGRSGLRWPAWQAICFYAGLALLASVYLGPMGAWLHTFFWVHMTQHLVVTMAAAPLIVLGEPITLVFRASGPVNRRRLVRVMRSTTVRWLTDPVLTWVVFASVIVGAHFTPFYDWSLDNHGVMTMIEQPVFLIAALLYYLPLIGSNLLPRRPSHGARLLSLGLMMIPEAVVGAVIYFSPVVLYDGYDVRRPFGLDAMTDQQLAGGMMWGLVMVIDSFWMMWVAAEWWSAEERAGRRSDAELARAAQ